MVGVDGLRPRSWRHQRQPPAARCLHASARVER